MARRLSPAHLVLLVSPAYLDARPPTRTLEDLAQHDGRLLRVLPDWYVDAGITSLYYTVHKLLPAKTRVFVDFVLEQFRARQLDQRFSAL